ncbi:MAG: LacI family DNA-binding transcriptional regulator [Candidatus Omnitrophota bacterium]
MRALKLMSKTVNIEDVARRAGVSAATVSRVINNHSGVREQNRIKVQQVIDELGFRPNIIARQLVRGRSNTISMVIPRYEGIFYSHYAIEILRGVGMACENLEMDLLLHIVDERSKLNLTGIGGVIFSEMLPDSAQLKHALALHVPAVLMNNLVQDLDVTCVTINNQQAAIEAVNYLIDLGHRDIAYISGGFATQAALERTRGFKAAMEKRDIPVPEEFVVHGDYSRKSAREATERLLSLEHRPTAIFAASDDMAQEAVSVIMEKGLGVPKDISVVGFDDSPVSVYGAVPLTTIHQPLLEMAKLAVRELDLLIRSSNRINKFSLPTRLIIRESCRAIRA